MSDDFQCWVVDAHRWSPLLGTRVDNWKVLCGLTVEHTSHGAGIIKGIEPRDARSRSGVLSFRISIEFGNSTKHFAWDTDSATKFLTYALFRDVESIPLPLRPGLMRMEEFQELAQKRELEEQERQSQLLREKEIREEQEKARQEQKRLQEAEEAESRMEFFELRQQYFVASVKDESPGNPLFSILKRIQDRQRLGDDEIRFLSTNEYHGPYAWHLKLLYESHGYSSVLAELSSRWRRAGKPALAIEVTNGIESFPEGTTESRSEKAKVLTSRGGAFTDEGAFKKGEACGLEAIKLMPTDYYPHNMLGRNFLLQGEVERSEHHFRRAQELGSPPATSEKAIRKALGDANPLLRRRAAEYLLSQDSAKYAFAKRYLH